jgi:hypothetical protein
LPEEVAVATGVVTEILTVPAAWALVTAVILDALVTLKLDAVVVPNLTVVAPLKPPPLIVTEVPPFVLPEVGVKLVIDGGGTRNV